MVVDLRRNPRNRYVGVLRDGDGSVVLTVRARRRGVDGQPIRREPEPIITIESARRYYETHTMGNDVYEWDWEVIGNGQHRSNFPEHPVEHQVSDGVVILMRKIFERSF